MITLKDQLKEIGRELGMRRNLYPKWVASKRMTQDEAETRIAVMDSVYQTLKSMEARDAALDAIHEPPQEPTP